jgi:hypothetical protein
MKKMIVICAWCKLKMKEADTWQTRDLASLAVDQMIVSHGICPACEAEETRKMLALIEKGKQVQV